MAAVHIEPNTYQYPKLISKIEQGMIKIPAFQRNFVWSMDKTLFLLDSICRRYPIGTFLFWQSSEFINALRNIGNLDLADPPRGYPVQYVLDGQQRITSLYAALNSAQIDGTTYRIAVDLDSTPASEEVFFAREPDNERHVLLSELLGEDYGDLFSKLTSPRQKRFNDLRTTFLNYPFSVTLVEGGNLDIVCDLFERINNTGIELSVFDLLVARTWSPPDENGGGFDLREAFDELRNELGEVGFGGVPEPVIAQLAGAVIKGDCRRKEILDIGRDEMRSAWPNIAEAMCCAVDFVRKKMRVTASKLLPYPSILVSFSYFFERNGLKNPDGRQSNWLRRYFYMNGFSNRLSSGTQTKLTDDLKALGDLARGSAAEFEVPVAIEPSDIRNTELRVGNAYCRSVLCLLASQRPLDFRDASEVILLNRALKRANCRHYHHIFPKAHMRGKVGAEEVNSIANIALIPADLNMKIGKAPPSRYFEKYREANSSWERTLRSHVIRGQSQQLLETGDFPKFLNKRARAISRLAKKAVHSE